MKLLELRVRSSLIISGVRLPLQADLRSLSARRASLVGIGEDLASHQESSTSECHFQVRDTLQLFASLPIGSNGQSVLRRYIKMTSMVSEYTCSFSLNSVHPDGALDTAIRGSSLADVHYGAQFDNTLPRHL